jgi:hypothetical protein
VIVRNEQDFELILRYLSAQGKAVASSVDGKRLVKFTHSWSQRCTGITDMETSYVRMRELEKRLEATAARLTAQCTSLVENHIRVYVQQGNRQQALRYLKRKQMLEKSLEANEAKLANVQHMMHTFEQADTNALAVQVYQESASALREANRRLDLTSVERTLEDLQDAMDTQADVEEALRSPLSSAAARDEDAELNKELDRLLADADVCASYIKKGLTYDEEEEKGSSKAAFDMADMLAGLPSVPQTPLSHDKSSKQQQLE